MRNFVWLISLIEVEGEGGGRAGGFYVAPILAGQFPQMCPSVVKCFHFLGPFPPSPPPFSIPLPFLLHLLLLTREGGGGGGGKGLLMADLDK